MKLLLVTCLKEYQDDVAKLFKEANIHSFCTTDVVGFKDNHSPELLEEWFASGDENFDSRLLFGFTGMENAEKGIELIKKYNEQKNNDFPVKAYILPVEKAIY